MNNNNSNTKKSKRNKKLLIIFIIAPIITGIIVLLFEYFVLQNRKSSVDNEVIVTDYSNAINSTGSKDDLEETDYPSATISRIWVDHDIYKYDQKGMNIHIKFYAYNMQNIGGRCVVYFYSTNGKILKAYNNSSNRTNSGYLSIGEDFYPYDRNYFSDFVLFFPYNEFNFLDEGETNLKAYAILWAYPPTEEPKKLATSDWFHFTYRSN